MEEWTSMVKVAIIIMVSLVTLGVVIFIVTVTNKAGNDQLSSIQAGVNAISWDEYEGRRMNAQMARNIARMHYEQIPIFIDFNPGVITLEAAWSHAQRVPFANPQDAHDRINARIPRNLRDWTITLVRNATGNVVGMRFH